MAKLDSNLSTLGIAAAIALTISAVVSGGPFAGGSVSSANAADAVTNSARSPWAASATGRIEPKDGEIRIGSQVAGLIIDVPVKTNDKVLAGDVLVRLDDVDLRARLVAAKAEVEVRQLERDEEPATKGLSVDRRKAQDAVSAAEREVFNAQQAFDLALAIFRAGNGKADYVSAARQRVINGKSKLVEERAALSKLEENQELPLMTRLETALEQSRADLSQVEAAIERTRIRAPSDGTVLNVFARNGELAAPSPDAPLLTFGDVTSLRVRAELEEREVVKVRPGQAAVVRVDAYPDRDFAGTVTSTSASLGSPRIVARGPRRPNDVEVLEVLVALDGQPPLLPGMRVDVFFKADSGQQSSLEAGAAAQ
jgi:HlyD family secretion protein